MKKPRLVEVKETPLLIVEPPAESKIIYAYVPKKKELKEEN